MQLPRRHEDAKVHKELNINKLSWRLFVPLRLSGKKKDFSEQAQLLNPKSYFYFTAVFA
jgi:hypothetical protein